VSAREQDVALLKHTKAMMIRVYMVGNKGAKTAKQDGFAHDMPKNFVRKQKTTRRHQDSKDSSPPSKLKK
jgi:hypothetical protein